MSDAPVRLAVFASGGGSNFEAIAEYFSESTVLDVVVCVSNKPDAGALEKAKLRGIATAVINTSDSTSYIRSINEVVEQHGVTHIALAGYLKMIPAGLIGNFRNRILNIHPSLLPAFGGKGMYGRRVHEAVIESGTRWSGATVHFVDESYDTGPIIMQEPVPVSSQDDAATLANRILKVEHRLYPRVLELLARGRIEVEGNRVYIRDPLNDS